MMGCRAADWDADGRAQHSLAAPERGGAGAPAHCRGHRQGEPGLHVHMVDAMVLGCIVNSDAGAACSQHMQGAC